MHIEWESDGTNSDEFLAVLLRPSLGLELLPYLNGKSAPRPKGMVAKQAYATAVATGPYAPPRGEDGDLGTVEVRFLAAHAHPRTHSICPRLPLATRLHSTPC